MRTLAGAMLAVAVAAFVVAVIGSAWSAWRGDGYRPGWISWAVVAGGAFGGLSVFPAWAGGGWHASPLITLGRWSVLAGGGLALLGAAAWGVGAVAGLAVRRFRTTVRARRGW